MSRLSPVNQARWARFRHNRRGYWSLWIFLVLFGLSLCSELIANDKPLLVRYDGSWCFRCWRGRGPLRLCFRCVRSMLP